MTRQELLAMSRGELQAALDAGHPFDPATLDGTTYRGISLGLPAWLERLTWKKFAKAFRCDPASGEVRGWNIRIEQDGLDQPWRPRQRDGAQWTFGHFAVIRERGQVVLDYGAGSARRTDPLRLVRDPLVAIRSGSVDLLLGRSDLALGARRVRTPSYFLLEA